MKFDLQQKPLIRLVDDDERVRASEAFVLSLEGWETKGFASAEEFLREDDPSRPGCIVLDVRMPGMSGTELQLELKKQGRTTPILFLSGHGDLDMAVMTLKRGAADFLQKPIAPEALQAAVARLVRWHLSLCRSQEEKDEICHLLASLSPKEKDVVQLAAKGLLNKEIAGLLGTSEQTVKQQRTSAARKLGVRSAVEFLELLSIAQTPLDVRVPLVETTKHGVTS